jgi:hypothetical protein
VGFLCSKWLVIDPDCITQQGRCQLHVSGKKGRSEGNFHRLGRRGCQRTVSADKADRPLQRVEQAGDVDDGYVARRHAKLRSLWICVVC